MPAIKQRGAEGVLKAKHELKLIEPTCRWTSGEWETMGGLKWNEVQNVPRHIQTLSWVLINAYLEVKEEGA